MATRRPAPFMTELADDQVVGLADSFDALEIFLGHLDAELFLQRHYQFDEIETVGVEIVAELCLWNDLVFRDRQHLDGAFAEAGEHFLIHDYLLVFVIWTMLVTVLSDRAGQ